MEKDSNLSKLDRQIIFTMFTTIMQSLTLIMQKIFGIDVTSEEFRYFREEFSNSKKMLVEWVEE